MTPRSGETGSRPPYTPNSRSTFFFFAPTGVPLVGTSPPDLVLRLSSVRLCPLDSKLRIRSIAHRAFRPPLSALVQRRGCQIGCQPRAHVVGRAKCLWEVWGGSAK